MTFREFVDPDGRSWEAWEVRPIAIERRLNEDRRAVPRFAQDRRNADLQFALHGSLREGWLTFQHGDDRRRISPIPIGWTAVSEAELIAMLAEAVPLRGAPVGVPKRRRAPLIAGPAATFVGLRGTVS
jgi:hypothetical protein